MAKRFEYVMFDGFMENGEYIHPSKVVELLNSLYNENQRLKQWNKCLAEEKEGWRDKYKQEVEKHSIISARIDKEGNWHPIPTEKER